MPINVKQAKQELIDEAKEAKRRQKLNKQTGIGMLTLKPGDSYKIQFLCDFENGIDIPWHIHKDDFKQSGPCYEAYGLPCPRCKNKKMYKQMATPTGMKSVSFFPVFVFPNADQDEDEKYPQVGVRVLEVKRASNHPWEKLIKYVERGDDLRDNKYIYDRNLADGPKTQYDLEQRKAAQVLDDVVCPTDDEIRMAVARLNDKELYLLLQEDEEEDKPKKRRPVDDDDEDEEVLLELKRQRKLAEQKEQEKINTRRSRKDDEEEEEPKPRTRKNRLVEDDEEDETPAKRPAKRNRDEDDDEEPVKTPRAKASKKDDDEEPIKAPRVVKTQDDDDEEKIVKRQPKAVAPVPQLKGTPVEDDEDDPDIDDFQLEVS